MASHTAFVLYAVHQRYSRSHASGLEGTFVARFPSTLYTLEHSLLPYIFLLRLLDPSKRQVFVQLFL